LKFFVMYAETCVEEYAAPGADIFDLERGCLNSEFQFLDKSPLSVEISDEGGIEFPDFILEGSIPLISAGVKRVFEKFGVDYVFYKPIQLTYSLLGRAENYWLAVPPRIDCLDTRKSIIEVEDNEFLLPTELIREAKKICIAENQIGRYDIFKLAGVVNQEIIITERLKNALAAENFENVFFYELEE